MSCGMQTAGPIGFPGALREHGCGRGGIFKNRKEFCRSVVSGGAQIFAPRGGSGLPGGNRSGQECPLHISRSGRECLLHISRSGRGGWQLLRKGFWLQLLRRRCGERFLRSDYFWRPFLRWRNLPGILFCLQMFRRPFADFELRDGQLWLRNLLRQRHFRYFGLRWRMWARGAQALRSLRRGGREPRRLLEDGQLHDVGKQCPAASVERMLVFGKHQKIGRSHEIVVERRNFLKVVSRGFN